MGKYCRSMGHEAVMVNLQKRPARPGISPRKRERRYLKLFERLVGPFDIRRGLWVV